MLGDPRNPYNLPPAFTAHADEAEPRDHGAAARRYVTAIAAFVQRHRHVLECHPVEFLTEQPMARLPAAWLEELPSLEDRLGHGLLVPEPEPAPEPSPEPEPEPSPEPEPEPSGGLLGFFRDARALQMPRQPAEVAGEPGYRPLAQELRMFTKPKKIHEVERLSNVVLAVSPAPALAFAPRP